jgi:glyoxylase-like metal-dependent hydrolase (beta-lactamase superfamily II)
MSETYEILAIKYATKTARTRLDSFMFPDDHESPHPIDYFVWVIRNENRTILVDTGFDRAEARRRNCPVLLEPHEALKRIGITAESLETVIVSHLHFDHAGTLDEYPGARFHVQEAEVALCHRPVHV